MNNRFVGKDEFEEIGRELTEFAEKREAVIRQSRCIIALSKQIIYSVQRGNIAEAEKLMKGIKADVKALPAERYDADIQSVALQEYVEAACFFGFVKDKKLATRSELEVGTESYLLGLCDLTGELVRQAVNYAINKKYDEAMEIKELVEEIYGAFLKLDLRGGLLRKKADALRWDLKKLEEIALNIAMRKS